MQAPLRVMTFNRGGEVYQFRFERDDDPNYPHWYTSTLNGVNFTEGAGSASFEMALRQAFDDIETYGGDVCDYAHCVSCDAVINLDNDDTWRVIKDETYCGSCAGKVVIAE